MQYAFCTLIPQAILSHLLQKAPLTLRSKVHETPKQTVFAEIFQRRRQVQPVMCWELPVFVYWFGVYSEDSSKMFGGFREF